MTDRNARALHPIHYASASGERALCGVSMPILHTRNLAAITCGECKSVIGQKLQELLVEMRAEPDQTTTRRDESGSPYVHPKTRDRESDRADSV